MLKVVELHKEEGNEVESLGDSMALQQVGAAVILWETRKDDTYEALLSTHDDFNFFVEMICQHFDALTEQVMENRADGMPITLSFGTEQMIIKDGIAELLAKCQDFFNQQSKFSNHKS